MSDYSQVQPVKDPNDPHQYDENGNVITPEGLESEGIADVVKPFKKTALQKMQEAGLPDLAAKVIDVATPDGIEGYAMRALGGARKAGRAVSALRELGPAEKAGEEAGFVSQATKNMQDKAAQLRTAGQADRASEAEEAASGLAAIDKDPYRFSKTKPVPKLNLGK